METEGRGLMSVPKKEFIWLIFYLGLIIGTIEMYTYLSEVKVEGANNFNSRPFFFYSMLTSLGFGFYLGIPHLIKEYQKEGRWSVKIYKLIVVCIPMLILLLGSIGYFLNYTLYHLVKPITELVIADHYEIGMVVTAILGFNLVKSIYKKN